MRYLYRIIVGGMLIVTGCAPSQSGVKDDNMSRHISQPTYQILKSGAYVTDQELYAQKNAHYLTFCSHDPKERAKFAALYQKLTGETAPDFTGTIVIGTMGTKPSGGYALELKEVRMLPEGIEVRFLPKQPAKDAMVTMALTHPFVVVLLPDYFKEVKITEAK